VALIILEPAQSELAATQAWYEKRKIGLYDRLFAEFLVVLDNITRRPESWDPLLGGFRRCRMNKFPYGIVHSARGNDIIVVAVAHHKRRLGYWRHRL
jgi:toxin ParE2